MAVLAAERIERPASLFGLAPEAGDGLGRRCDGDMSDGPTLDDAVVGAWEGLVARLAVACPLCGGSMRPRPSVGDVAAGGGRCGDCGTTLS